MLVTDTMAVGGISGAVALLTLCVTVFLWVNTRMSAISERIDMKIGASEEKASRARHEGNNSIQVETGRLDLRVGALEREVVRDADLRAVEDRIGGQITELKVSLKDSSDKLGEKISKLTEAVIRGEAAAQTGRDNNAQRRSTRAGE